MPVYLGFVHVLPIRGRNELERVTKPGGAAAHPTGYTTAPASEGTARADTVLTELGKLPDDPYSSPCWLLVSVKLYVPRQS
jgi:hypothetical protein